MNQVKQITNENNNLQTKDSNRFAACEQVVDALCNQGLPKVFNPSTFISKISSNFGISQSEARTCLKLAIKQLESQQTEKEEPKQETERFAQSGYFYPSKSYTTPATSTKVKDEMDSLASLGAYNRLMFGLR